LSILIYSGRADALGEQLQEIIEERFRNWTIEPYTGIRELSERLRKPLYDVDTAVLLASTKRDLEGLLSLQDILCSLPLILILPDTDHESISKAHRLCPRFVAYARNGFRDVALVLGKMLERSARLRKAEGR